MGYQAGHRTTPIKLKTVFSAFEIYRAAIESCRTQCLVQSMQIIEVAFDIRQLIVMFQNTAVVVTGHLLVGQTRR